MARPSGAPNLYPSVDRQRAYLKRLRKMADEGDPTAIGWICWLTAVRQTNRHREATQ